MLANINKLFNGKNDPIKFVDDYSSIFPEAKRKVAEEERGSESSKAKTKLKKLPLELYEEIIKKIKNDEENFNKQIFKEYFFNQTPLF